jgi:hypothetical protein
MQIRRFWTLFWALFLVLAGLVAWFMGNLVYTALWAALRDRGFPVTEAQMVTYIVAHLLPFVLILVVGAILSVLIRNQIATSSAAAVETFRLHEIEALQAHTAALDRHVDANDPVRRAINENIAAQLIPQPRILDIEIGESGPFMKTTGGGGLHDIKRTFNIKLSNIHGSKAAEFCKLQIIAIENQTEYEGPWILKEWRTLPAGDHEFIPLATYGEARNPKDYNCADSFFVVLAQPGQLKLNIGKEYIFLLRATAHDIPKREFRCKLWIGEDGRFHIEKA